MSKNTIKFIVAALMGAATTTMVVTHLPASTPSTTTVGMATPTPDPIPMDTPMVEETTTTTTPMVENTPVEEETPTPTTTPAPTTSTTRPAPTTTTTAPVVAPTTVTTAVVTPAPTPSYTTSQITTWFSQGVVYVVWHNTNPFTAASPSITVEVREQLRGDTENMNGRTIATVTAPSMADIPRGEYARSQIAVPEGGAAAHLATIAINGEAVANPTWR